MTSILRKAEVSEANIARITAMQLKHNYYAFLVISVLFMLFSSMFLFQTSFFPNEVRYPWIGQAYFAAFGLGILLSAFYIMFSLLLHMQDKARMLKLTMHCFLQINYFLIYGMKI